MKKHQCSNCRYFHEGCMDNKFVGVCMAHCWAVKNVYCGCENKDGEVVFIDRSLEGGQKNIRKRRIKDNDAK